MRGDGAYTWSNRSFKEKVSLSAEGGYTRGAYRRRNTVWHLSRDVAILNIWRKIIFAGA